MDINLEKILACPICQSNLKINLSVDQGIPGKGEMTCLKCNRLYPIKKVITRMLTPGYNQIITLFL